MTDRLIELTTTVVASYVDGNTIAAADVPGLIRSTYAALAGVGAPEAPAAEEIAKPTPAQIRKSITPDAIISFEDGKSYKSLKRNLSVRGLTPAAYREKWGLPKDYPMVAPAYSAARSAMAKSIGLGAKRRAAMPAAAPKPTTAKASPATTTPKAKVGRPRKVPV